MFQQIGGTLLRTYFSDADVGIYLYPKGLTTGIISFTPDITYYKTIANGNPELRIGSDDANEAHFKAMYDSGAQTLDYLLISTDSAGEGDIVLSPASGFVGIGTTAPDSTYLMLHGAGKLARSLWLQWFRVLLYL
jgi:hypothetical protein